VTTESTSETGVDSTQGQVEVRSGTVLRARRQDIELHTAPWSASWPCPPTATPSRRW
jgi:hypothetical protein